MSVLPVRNPHRQLTSEQIRQQTSPTWQLQAGSAAPAAEEDNDPRATLCGSQKGAGTKTRPASWPGLSALPLACLIFAGRTDMPISLGEKIAIVHRHRSGL